MADASKSDNCTTATILDSIEEHNRGYSMSIGHEHTFYFVHVHKAKVDSALEIENPLYVVSLDRSKGLRLGLKLDVQVATRSLFIKEVVGGLAFAYNSGATEKKVKPGDRIVRVNAVDGDAHLMLEECKKRAVLELELHRGAAIPIIAGLKATVKRPFGNFNIGQEGSVAKVDDDGDALMQITGIGNQWVCKQDFGKFAFEDSDRFYLKRYSDFKDTFVALKTKIANGQPTPIKTLPDLPSEEHFGFRRQLSSMGMSSFMSQRKGGLQNMITSVLTQITTLEEEPVLAEFFGAHSIPNVGAAKEEILKQRLDQLVFKHQSLAQAKEG